MWKLGLDLGTNSIGWTVFTSEKTKPSWDDWRLEDAGVRTIPDGPRYFFIFNKLV